LTSSYPVCGVQLLSGHLIVLPSLIHEWSVLDGGPLGAAPDMVKLTFFFLPQDTESINILEILFPLSGNISESNSG
jgi:hypothetical protein